MESYSMNSFISLFNIPCYTFSIIHCAFNIILVRFFLVGYSSSSFFFTVVEYSVRIYHIFSLWCILYEYTTIFLSHSIVDEHLLLYPVWGYSEHYAGVFWCTHALFCWAYT